MVAGTIRERAMERRAGMQRADKTAYESARVSKYDKSEPRVGRNSGHYLRYCHLFSRTSFINSSLL